MASYSYKHGRGKEKNALTYSDLSHTAEECETFQFLAGICRAAVILCVNLKMSFDFVGLFCEGAVLLLVVILLLYIWKKENNSKAKGLMTGLEMVRLNCCPEKFSSAPLYSAR